MKINGFELNYSAEDLHRMVNEEMRPIKLIDKEHESYQSLSDGDKKAVEHLVNAAQIMNDVALEMDHPLNLVQKQALEVAAAESEYAADVLRLFNSLNGVAGSNGLDKKPVEIFKGIHVLDGCNFYPQDLTVDEFHNIINRMLDMGLSKEVAEILSARTMVRREGDILTAVDYTEYFAEEFAEIANQLECAAYYTTDELFKDYLGWQAQAFLQNNAEMDILADKLLHTALTSSIANGSSSTHTILILIVRLLTHGYLQNNLCAFARSAVDRHCAEAHPFQPFPDIADTDMHPVGFISGLLVKAYPVILYHDYMRCTFTVSGNFDDTFFAGTHTVPDRVFHQRLDRQRGDTVFSVPDIIFYADVRKSDHFDL